MWQTVINCVKLHRKRDRTAGVGGTHFWIMAEYFPVIFRVMSWLEMPIPSQRSGSSVTSQKFLKISYASNDKISNKSLIGYNNEVMTFYIQKVNNKLCCDTMVFCRTTFQAIIYYYWHHDLETHVKIVTIFHKWLDNELVTLILGAHLGTMVIVEIRCSKTFTCQGLPNNFS